jgi:SAM-dependent methyltransferase
VVVNQVFEHVFTPEQFLREVSRVLKSGGMLLMTVPFVWDEHEKPCDYARYTSFGLQSLLEKSGFEIVEKRKSVADIRAIFQLLNCYLHKKTLTGNKYVNLLSVFFLMSPGNLLGEILAKFLPKNDDLFLDTIVLARKVTDA